MVVVVVVVLSIGGWTCIGVGWSDGRHCLVPVANQGFTGEGGGVWMCIGVGWLSFVCIAVVWGFGILQTQGLCVGGGSVVRRLALHIALDAACLCRRWDCVDMGK